MSTAKHLAAPDGSDATLCGMSAPSPRILTSDLSNVGCGECAGRAEKMHQRNEKAHAVAKVKLSIEVPLDASWGGDCKLQQVWDQAREAASRIVTTALQKSGLRITVTESEVTAILIKDRR